MNAELLCERAADDRIRRTAGGVVGRPRAFDLPRWVQSDHAGAEWLSLLATHSVIKPRAYDCDGNWASGIACPGRDRQIWCKCQNIVPPENLFQLRKLRLRNVGAFGNRAIVDAADLHGKGIRRRRDDDVGAERAQFVPDSVADIERDG